MEKQKLLVALDQHSISTELCNYLGKIISGKQDLEISLLHILPPPPPQLREFRGSEDPEVEEQLDREMDAVWQRWTREAENTARPVFDNAISILELTLCITVLNSDSNTILWSRPAPMLA